MNCIKCGSKLDDAATYCNICGTIIKQNNIVNQNEKIDEVVKEVKVKTKFNKFILVILMLVVILLLTLIYYIYNNKSYAQVIPDVETTTTRKLILGDADLFSIAESVDLNINYDNFKSIVGYDGTLTNTSTYSFNGSRGEVMNITFNELGISSIEIEYTTDMLKSNKTDLVNAESMKNKIGSGLTITELLSTFGETGYVVKRDEFTKTYAWVNTNGYEITAIVDTFDNVIEINI